MQAVLPEDCAAQGDAPAVADAPTNAPLGTDRRSRLAENVAPAFDAYDPEPYVRATPRKGAFRRVDIQRRARRGLFWWGVLVGMVWGAFLIGILRGLYLQLDAALPLLAIVGLA